jgi:hypothetical protein
MRSYWKEKVAAPVYKTEITTVEIRCADYATRPLCEKVGTYFADKWRSLGRYSSLVDSGHGVFFVCFLFTYTLLVFDPAHPT